ncbi:MAG: phosphotransferase [Legionella sp.]|nr:phosphotransferase [Legionella sp.]
MLTRQNALHTWLNSLGDYSSFELTSLAGDASFRRYFRLQNNTSSFIVMDDPPEKAKKENLLIFVNIARALASSGIRTPEILAVDLKQGFALLEDFGDTLLFDEVASEKTSQHYQLALQTLHKIQQCTVQTPKLNVFGLSFMNTELQLFYTWFLDHGLSITLSHAEKKCLKQALTYITEQIIKQPQCFVHRDYHAQNLSLVGPDNQKALGVLDFQDAVQGPFTYDLVSLLKDARVPWPKETCLQRLNYFYDTLPNNYGWSRDAFEHGFHLCGLQLHLKILGIFCRLDQRDGKSHYLNNLPLVLKYVLDGLDHLSLEKPLRPFYDFMQTRVCPLFNEKKIS